MIHNFKLWMLCVARTEMLLKSHVIWNNLPNFVRWKLQMVSTTLSRPKTDTPCLDSRQNHISSASSSAGAAHAD